MDAYAHSLDPRVRQVQISLSGGLTDSLVVASDTGAAADIRPSLRLSCNVTMEENGVTVSGHGACGRCIDFSWLAEDVAVAPLEHVPGTYCAPDKLEIKKRYLAVAREAVRSAQDKKYVMMNAPKSKVKEITDVLPGIKSPTIIPLADDEWCSIHTVLDEKRFWEIIGKLKELDAQGILVTPIEKMIL